MPTLPSDRHDRVARIFADGSDANAPGSNGLSLLAQALENRDSKTARALLRAGASPNELGQPPMARVIVNLKTSQALPVVKALIELGADVNAKDDQGEPMLHLAIDYGEQEVALLLLQAGADPEARDPQLGRSALGRALDEDQEVVAQALVERGVDLWAMSAAGLDLLEQAIAEQDYVRSGFDYPGLIRSARERQELGQLSAEAGQPPPSAGPIRL